MAHSEPSDAGIPVLDISNATAERARKVLDAASTHGFLFIKNDGVTIPPKDINDMFDLSRQFFQSPQEAKQEFAIGSEKAGGKNRGWVKMQGEALDPDGQKQGDPKEAFNIAEPIPHLQPLPTLLSSQKQLIQRFQLSCHTLCTNILTLLGTSHPSILTSPKKKLTQQGTALSIPSSAGGSEWFTTRHDQSRGPSGTIFRLLYYPATKQEREGGESIRAGAHSDYGSVTLLFRLPGQPGLEILKEDGSWAAVPVNPNPEELSDAPILVNIGDLLSFWTSGMLKSTVHRVTFSGGEERYSMAYFCHPLDDAMLEKVPSKTVEESVDEGELRRQRERLGLGEHEKVITAGEHLHRRLKVTYGLEE
ncbi:hypothetical protein BDV96DRAFT_582129 [Lophiotrema nucula]|uniref:Fe2OG dioxygenase domain-containing protein n=1 Tax=Lophiotrema nucula TaxID=690887 RepID=A0A6A5YXU9_9PLEO|nr:hypothetical protein BDV96DRAFT_582129 [Lophiotrema nucula]